MVGLRVPLVALAGTLVAALAGCGHTHLVGRGGTLSLALTEYRITPQDVTVDAGQLSVFVRNYGRLAHNLVISRDGEADAATGPLQPGQTAQLEVTLEHGTYQMQSTVLLDQTLGEYGTLNVH